MPHRKRRSPAAGEDPAAVTGNPASPDLCAAKQELQEVIKAEVVGTE